MDMRHYSSFLLRCWDLDHQEERVEIEHIQSHDSTLLHSIGDALEWMRATHRGAEPTGAVRSIDHPDVHPTQGEAT